MNNKIEKLLNELGWGMGDPSDDCMQCSPFDPYEFAKRIIQESAAVADDNFNKGFCPVGNIIKKHFGV
jgi:hypothetical protein